MLDLKRWCFVTLALFTLMNWNVSCWLNQTPLIICNQIRIFTNFRIQYKFCYFVYSRLEPETVCRHVTFHALKHSRHLFVLPTSSVFQLRPKTKKTISWFQQPLPIVYIVLYHVLCHANCSSNLGQCFDHCHYPNFSSHYDCDRVSYQPFNITLVCNGPKRKPIIPKWDINRNHKFLLPMYTFCQRRKD